MISFSLRLRLKYTICAIVLISASLTGCSPSKGNGAPAKNTVKQQSPSNEADTTYSLNELLYTDISEALKANDTASIPETYTVVKGDVNISINYRATTNFTSIENIIQPYEDGRVTFVKRYLSSYSGSLGYYGYMKKGEPIVKLMFHADETDIREALLALEKEEALYNITRTEMEAELARLKQLAKNSTSIEERLLHEFNYNDALNEYTEYVAAAEADIEVLREKYKLYSQGSFEFDVCTPDDGIVILPISYGKDFLKGDLFEYGFNIATLYKIENLTLNVKKTVHNVSEGNIITTYEAPIFNYGDKITIEDPYDSKENGYSLTGTVISSPNVLYDTDIISATIAFDDFDAALKALSPTSFMNGLYIRGTYTMARNVLLIPPSALEVVSENSGKVTIYNNGSLYKTNITYTHIGGDGVWVTSGLKEGDVIVVNPQ